MGQSSTVKALLEAGADDTVKDKVNLNLMFFCLMVFFTLCILYTVNDVLYLIALY